MYVRCEKQLENHKHTQTDAHTRITGYAPLARTNRAENRPRNTQTTTLSPSPCRCACRFTLTHAYMHTQNQPVEYYHHLMLVLCLHCADFPNKDPTSQPASQPGPNIMQHRVCFASVRSFVVSPPLRLQLVASVRVRSESSPPAAHERTMYRRRGLRTNRARTKSVRITHSVHRAVCPALCEVRG